MRCERRIIYALTREQASKIRSVSMSPQTQEENTMGYAFKLTGDTTAVKQRQKVEQTIARAVVDALLAAGFTLGVYDGEEVVVHHTADKGEILKALFNTDEDYLYVYKDKTKPHETTPYSWVRFVYGNDGWDVISDYLTDLEPLIGEGTEVSKLIDKYIG